MLFGSEESEKEYFFMFFFVDTGRDWHVNQATHSSIFLKARIAQSRLVNFNCFEALTKSFLVFCLNH